MIGGPPMMSLPQFVQPAPRQPAPPRFPTGQTPVASAGSAASQSAVANQPPPRTVRGQSPDEPGDNRSTSLVLPPPEQLGIVAVKNTEAAVDWAAAHRRLDQLGATCFHLERL